MGGSGVVPVGGVDAAFVEMFESAESLDRFQWQLHHGASFFQTDFSWLGDHDESCGPPTTTRDIEVVPGVVLFPDGMDGIENYGNFVYWCAPGGDITIDQNYDSYGDGILQQTHNGVNLGFFYYYFKEGTSPATALVSGVAALVISKSSIDLSPIQVKRILETSATDLGAQGWDQYYGWGLINAYSALLYTP